MKESAIDFYSLKRIYQDKKEASSQENDKSLIVAEDLLVSLENFLQAKSISELSHLDEFITVVLIRGVFSYPPNTVYHAIVRIDNEDYQNEEKRKEIISGVVSNIQNRGIKIEADNSGTILKINLRQFE